MLRQLRAEARLTQEELAEASGVRPRSVSDLERGVSRTAHKETAQLLAGALGLAGPVRALFVAAARGKAPAAEVLAARAAVPDLADGEQALAWARAERASLLACLDHAAGTGQHGRVIALTAGLAGLLRSDGPWAEAIARHQAAIQAARHLGDRLGQAGALNDLGVARRLTDDYPAADGARWCRSDGTAGSVVIVGADWRSDGSTVTNITMLG